MEEPPNHKILDRTFLVRGEIEKNRVNLCQGNGMPNAPCHNFTLFSIIQLKRSETGKELTASNLKDWSFYFLMNKDRNFYEFWNFIAGAE